MHELSICRALMREIKSIAAARSARRVRSVTLRVGPLSGVESSLLRTAFPCVSLGTIADGSELYIERTPLRVRCERCGAETDAQPGRLVCGACGDWHTVLLSGDELMLTNVELVV